MRFFTWNHPLVRSTGIGILLLCALSLPYSQVLATPPNTLKSTPTDTSVYKIEFAGDIPKTVCVGQQIALTATFGWTGFLPPSLTRQVSSIEFSSSNINTIAPGSINPGTNAGGVGTNYVAENAGNDDITVILNTMDSWGRGLPEQSASNMITIKVLKECKYHFDLNAELNVEFERDGALLTARYELRSEGDLIGRDPAQPLKMESKNAKVEMYVTIKDIKTEGCTLVKADPGYGKGTLDATTEPVFSKGTDMLLTLGPIQGFSWTATAVGQCGDQSKTVTVGGALAPSTSPLAWFWYSIDGGSAQPEVSVFEQSNKYVRGAGGTSGYSATLTLKRVEGE
jgi:hypothetical protein